MVVKHSLGDERYLALTIGISIVFVDICLDISVFVSLVANDPRARSSRAGQLDGIFSASPQLFIAIRIASASDLTLSPGRIGFAKGAHLQEEKTEVRFCLSHQIRS